MVSESFWVCGELAILGFVVIYSNLSFVENRSHSGIVVNASTPAVLGFVMIRRRHSGFCGELVIPVLW